MTILQRWNLTETAIVVSTPPAVWHCGVSAFFFDWCLPIDTSRVEACKKPIIQHDWHCTASVWVMISSDDCKRLFFFTVGTTHVIKPVSTMFNRTTRSDVSMRYWHSSHGSAALFFYRTHWCHWKQVHWSVTSSAEEGEHRKDRALDVSDRGGRRR